MSDAKGEGDAIEISKRRDGIAALTCVVAGVLISALPHFLAVPWTRSRAGIAPRFPDRTNDGIP